MARAVWGSSVQVCDSLSGSPHFWQSLRQASAIRRPFNQGSGRMGLQGYLTLLEGSSLPTTLKQVQE